jgi:hypothetical protein
LPVRRVREPLGTRGLREVGLWRRDGDSGAQSNGAEPRFLCDGGNFLWVGLSSRFVLEDGSLVPLSSARDAAKASPYCSGSRRTDSVIS